MSINDLTNDQVIAIAKSLNWKEQNDSDKIRRTLNLNWKSAKVQSVVKEEIDRAKNKAEEEAVAAALADSDVHFGMAEEEAAKYIQEQFGLTPKMAKRAIMRGVNRNEYYGRGYVVKCVDVNEESYDISVSAA